MFCQDDAEKEKNLGRQARPRKRKYFFFKCILVYYRVLKKTFQLERASFSIGYTELVPGETVITYICCC